MEKDLIKQINPDYYNRSEMSCIDGMVGAFGKKEVATFCKINAMKYIWRLGHKDEEAQEIGKIKWYLDKYLELTKPHIRVQLDAEELVCDDTLSTSGAALDILFGKPELLRKGLTDREAENIINKK